jgi:hypothetical protein
VSLDYAPPLIPFSLHNRNLLILAQYNLLMRENPTKILYMEGVEAKGGRAYTVKKNFVTLPSSAGMSLTKLSLGGNN